jgi:chemotaxis regulatin CheY-phosphate phosphatase CheZ
MSGIASRQSDLEAEFKAIELAVRETERGRWFLSEFARRNRHADTEMLLSAIARIERNVGVPRDTAQADNLRLDILELSRVIARTRSEIAAIRPADAEADPLTEASGELTSIVTSTESATSAILAAAEKVQAAAWSLREAKADPSLCDALDSRATEIYVACSFQDLTAQRTRKVIETLTFIEQRLQAMADIWRVPRSDATAKPAADVGGMSQADVDSVLVGQGERAGARPEAVDEILFSPPVSSPPPDGAARLQLVESRQASPSSADLPSVPEAPTVDDALRKVRAGQALSSEEAARALDTLQGLSVEERARIFS